MSSMVRKPNSIRRANFSELRIFTHLDGGGMGNIFRGGIRLSSSTSSYNQVVVKTISTEANGVQSPSTKTQEAFNWEAYVTDLVSLNAPGVGPHFYGIVFPEDMGNFEINNQSGANIRPPFLVMEFLDGIELSNMVYRPMPINNAITITYQLLKALAALEPIGIVHRDIKPRNLHITRASRLKILDFGLALMWDNGKYWGWTGTKKWIAGTYEYLAPEYLEHGKEMISPRLDAYAAGVTVVELLRGRQPFLSGTNTNLPDFCDVRKKILETNVDRAFITGGREDLPGQFVQVVQGLLEKDPTKRLDAASASSIIEDAYGSTIDLDVITVGV